MKILKLKSILFILMAIGMSTVFLTSCEYDPVADNPAIIEQGDNFSMPEGHLKTELDLSIDGENGALIAVSTNNNEIFAQLTDTNLKVELITLKDMEDSAGSNVEVIDGIDEDLDESLLNTDEHFFSMKILEEYTKDGENIQYTFGDKLLNVLEKYKAQTHIQISSEKDNTINSRYDVYKSNVEVYGDGDHDGLRTKLKMRYDYNCGGQVYYRNTSVGFYNSYDFHSCIWPDINTKNRADRKRYTYFSTIQDQVRSFHRGDSGICYRC